MAKLEYLHRNDVELIISKQSTISYPLHNHVSVFTLGFVYNGTIELITDKGSKIYQKDDLFIILPYAPHCVNAISCYTLLNICIHCDIINKCDFKHYISDIKIILHDKLNCPILETKIIQAVNSIILIGQMMPTQKETNISKLMKKIEAYPEQKYNIGDMAKTAFLSKYHLIRTFKHEVGLTPHQFQIQNRIRKAQKLLRDSATLAEVALATGFCDQSHFIRHFEKIVGLTPTDYKKACKANLYLFPA